jgi:hypothetical protein
MGELDPKHMFRSPVCRLFGAGGCAWRFARSLGVDDALFEIWTKSDPAAVIKALTDVPHFSARKPADGRRSIN